MSLVRLHTPLYFPAQSRCGGLQGFISSAAVMNSASEAAFMVGKVRLEDPEGGSKTISSAGGKIHWISSSATFANAGTTLRIGLQDVSTTLSPAQGDGTFDVYDDLVGGTDTITAGVYRTDAMSAGTKTIADGDLVAIGWFMTSRGGTDQVAIGLAAISESESRSLMPSTCTDTTGAGTFALVATYAPNVGIEFDDGTVGWLYGAYCTHNDGSQAYNLDSATADEYGTLFTMPFNAAISGASMHISVASTAADFEVVLYSDPLGTPVAERTVTVDSTLFNTSAGDVQVPFATEMILKKGVSYALTLRPTTTANVSLRYVDFGDVKFNVFGGPVGSAYGVRRIGNSGAFSEYNVNGTGTRVYQISALLSKIADDRSTASYSAGVI